MRNSELFLAVMMTSLFVLMFWAQIGGIATNALVGPKVIPYGFAPGPYLPSQPLDPVY
jgi:hypothetical protein